MSPPSKAEPTRIVFALASLAALLASAPAFCATDVPRYAQRRVYGMKPGPRLVVVVLGGVSWAQLRQADTPNLRVMIERGSIGLMPVASLTDRDRRRTFVTLGAGRTAVSGGVGQVTRVSDGGWQTEIAAITAANEESGTGARPGLLGTRLKEAGLTRAVVGGGSASKDELFSLGAAILMDSQGKLDGGEIGDPLVSGGMDWVRLDGERLTRALLGALTRYDATVLDLTGLAGSDSAGMPRPPRHLPDPKPEALQIADRVIGAALQELSDQEALLAVVCPVSPSYPNSVVHKSLGPILLYDTKHPQRGLLYTHRTRWPGLVTAADLAPTVLQWWQIEGVPLGQPLTVRLGGPADIDRLDRTLSDHYAWGFPAVKLYMTFCFLVLVLGLWFTLRRPDLLPRLRGPALAIPLIPVALLVAPRLGGGGLYSFLLVSVLLTAAAVLAATRFRRPELALAVPMVLGAAVILWDTLTGAWLTRTAPYAFPVVSGSRFYGLGNEYMGVLLGLSVIGLAAAAQGFPWADRFFAPAAAVVVLVIGAPFWGANWGGAFSAAVGLGIAWLLLREREARYAVPIALGAVILSVLLPAALDLMVSPNAAQRTHIGATASALLSGRGSSLGGVFERKLQMSLHVLFYSPWTLVLAAAAVAAFWILLREGAPARLALSGRRQLVAGLAGAVASGVVAMVVNDSGVVAGAGALAAAMTAALVLAATPREQAA